MRFQKLGSAVVLASVVTAMAAVDTEGAKRKPLTQTEKELRGWLWERSAKTKIPVAYQAALGNPVTVYTSAGSVTLVTLNTDVDRSGRVSYQGRSMIGMKFDVPQNGIRTLTRVESEVKIVGFTLKDDRVAVQVQNPHGSERGNVRLWLGDGYQRHMDAAAIVGEIAEVLDFGPDVDKLLRVRAELQKVRQRVVLQERVFRDGSRDVGERIASGHSLQQSLEEALRVQEEYDGLTNSESPEKTALRNSQVEVAAEVARLNDIRLGFKREEIALAMETVEKRLVEADSQFRDSNADSKARLATAREIVVSLEAIVTECEEYEKIGGSELEAEAGVRQALEGFSGWLERSEEALAEGCLREEGLGLDEIERLLAVPAPDATVAREIERCGVAFEPDQPALDRLVGAGLGELARAALAAGEASRLARADLPRLEEILEQAATALEGAPVANTRARAPSSEVESAYDTASGLHWSTPAGGKLDHFDAERFCRELDGGGSGWRVPTIAELEKYSFGAGHRRVAGLVIWSRETRGSKSALTYDITNRRQDKARRKFSLRNAICVR